MKRRNSLFVFVSLLVLASSLFAQASRQDEITLIMVPREDVPVKIGMDLAGRYSTLLIRYHVLANGSVSLNGWTGTEWVNITLKDFQAGNFFHKGPNSALVIGAEGATVPAALIPPSEWGEVVYQIGTTRTRPLLHLIGQYYDFKYKDWQWFAERYTLPLEAINPESLNIAWYHKRLKENLSKRSEVEGSDLRFWSIIRYPQAPVLATESVEPDEKELVIASDEPVVEEEPIEAAETVQLDNKETETPAAEEVIEEEAPIDTPASVEDAPAEQLAVPQPEDPEVNPLVIEVPTALVLGAGDADETQPSPVEPFDDVQP